MMINNTNSQSFTEGIKRSTGLTQGSADARTQSIVCRLWRPHSDRRFLQCPRFSLCPQEAPASCYVGSFIIPDVCPGTIVAGEQ